LELTLGAVEPPSAALARNPSIKTIEKIAQALHVPVVKLFEDRSSHRKWNDSGLVKGRQSFCLKLPVL
jgi:transcriptional regulator with XRE-family HTH domain